MEQVIALGDVLAAAACSLGTASAALSLALAANHVERGVRAAGEMEVVDDDHCLGSCTLIACR